MTNRKIMGAIALMGVSFMSLASIPAYSLTVITIHGRAAKK